MREGSERDVLLKSRHAHQVRNTMGINYLNFCCMLHAGLIRCSLTSHFSSSGVVFTKGLGAETLDGLVDAFEAWPGEGQRSHPSAKTNMLSVVVFG